MGVEAEETRDGADALANPSRVDAGANSFDDAGGLVPVLCREAWSFKILSAAEHDLGAVEANGFDTEAYLSLTRLGNGEFIELEDFGAASLVEANDPYAVGHANSSNLSTCVSYATGCSGCDFSLADGVMASASASLP